MGQELSQLEAGSATVASTAVLAAMLAITGISMGAVATLNARAQLQAQVEVAALAGAAASPSSLLSNTFAACDVAESIMAANSPSAHTSCWVEDEDIWVNATRNLGWSGIGLEISGKARAGFVGSG